MNKNCEKNPAHSQNILHVDALEVCITLKERNTKRFVQNWHLPKSFDRMVRIFFYRTCNVFFICYAVGLLQYSKNG